jgi:hypothetical protein
LNSQSLYWEVMLFGSARIRKRTSLASCGAARAPGMTSAVAFNGDARSTSRTPCRTTR